MTPTLLNSPKYVWDLNIRTMLVKLNKNGRHFHGCQLHFMYSQVHLDKGGKKIYIYDFKIRNVFKVRAKMLHLNDYDQP